MNTLGTRVFRTGDFEIDAAQRAIRRNDEVLRPRARTFELLLYLIDHRERVVPKQELRDALWPGIAVTDNSVMQCVNEVRQTLGDDFRNPRFIRTVSKTGYQFIGPVTTGQAELAVEPSKARRRRVPWWAFAAILACLLVGAAAYRITIPSGSGTLVIAAFDNQTGAADLEWLREGLPEMLITTLSRAPELRLIRAKPSGPSAVKASTRLEGSFARLGGRIRVTARIQDARDGSLRASESFVADDPSQILVQIDLMGLRLATSLGYPIRQRDKFTELASLMTGNIEAYRNYALGLEKAQSLQPREALGFFQRAVDLDPSFAMARARMGYTYAVTWGQPSNAKPHLDQAFRASGHLTPRDRLYVAAWYALANHDYRGAIRSYRELIANDMADTEAYIHLGSLLSGEGKAEEAIDVLRKALVLNPDSPSGWNSLSGAYRRAGRAKESLDAAERYVALTPSEPNAWDTLAMAHHIANRPAEAERAYRRALSLNSNFEVALIHLGGLLFQRGRYREAIQTCERYIEVAPSPIEKARGHACLSEIYRRLGKVDEARRHARQERQFTPGRPSAEAILGLDAGESSAAKELLAWTDQNDRGRRSDLRGRLYLEGRIALAEGRRAEALDKFRAALREPAPFYLPDWWEDCLADGYFVLGMHEQAVTEYSRALALYPAIPLPRFRLASALEKLGRAEEALTEYRRFLEEWKDADTDIPEVVQSRERLIATAVATKRIARR